MSKAEWAVWDLLASTPIESANLDDIKAVLCEELSGEEIGMAVSKLVKSGDCWREGNIIGLKSE